MTLQEKDCLLIWSDSGGSVLQLSQYCDVAVRVNDFSRFQESQRDHPFQSQKTMNVTLPMDDCLDFFSSVRNSRCRSVDCCCLYWWCYISPSIMMQSRILSTSATCWFNRSWKIWRWCSFCSCFNICWIHRAQDFQCFNVANITSNTLKPILSSMHSS